VGEATRFGDDAARVYRSGATSDGAGRLGATLTQRSDAEIEERSRRERTFTRM